MIETAAILTAILTALLVWVTMMGAIPGSFTFTAERCSCNRGGDHVDVVVGGTKQVRLVSAAVHLSNGFVEDVVRNSFPRKRPLVAGDHLFLSVPVNHNPTPHTVLTVAIRVRHAWWRPTATYWQAVDLHSNSTVTFPR